MYNIRHKLDIAGQGLDSAIKQDLGIGIPYQKGHKIPVRRCWHFYTDGAAVDFMFYDEADFRAGINRIYIVLKRYKVVIIAFCLMDTHFHFILYGEFEECNRFVHEFLRLTSADVSKRHGERHKFMNVSIGYQTITDDEYLKTAICYVIKNPVSAGLRYTFYDYPWSSGPLYFRKSGYWSSSPWSSNETDGIIRYHGSENLALRTFTERRHALKTRNCPEEDVQSVENLVFPGEFVRVDLVEEIFRTHKGFQYFVFRTKDDDVELRGGAFSYLQLPMQEMRQHKNELCMKLFGEKTIKKLDLMQRLKLARKLRAEFNCSPKQIARLCGLVYAEVKDKL